VNYLQAERLERLAAAYALGTMSPRAARRFQALLIDSREMQAAVTAWHERFNQLAISVPPVRPGAGVWQAIQNRVQGAPRASVRPSRRPWWLPAFGMALGAFLTVGLVREQPEWIGITPTSTDSVAPAYIGILTNAAGEPVVLASSLRQGRVLSLKMLKPVTPPVGMVARLWALPSDGRPPFALGLVPAGNKARLELSAPSEALFAKVGRLGVTFEPPGGGELPGSPFVLSGHCVKVWEPPPLKPPVKPPG
jgi:anti-sigma-K factor RskA